MNTFRADLHCHTTCSDGSLTPEQIVRLAVEVGLSGLSITDHDTIAAYETAVPIAAELGLQLLTGVEFSAEHRGSSIHVLAYGFSLEHPLIRDFCDQHSLRRRERNQGILTLLKKEGISISEHELQMVFGVNPKGKSWGRPHIAHLMVKKGYVKDAEEAFRKYIGDGKCAYFPGKTFSVAETIELIHAANAFAVLAHPMLVERKNVVRDLLNFPFDGLEAYYARISIEQQLYWKRIAEEQGLMVTGGSDFHGQLKPTISLGCSWVNEERFNELMKDDD